MVLPPLEDLEQASERIVREGRRASAGRRDQTVLDVVRVAGRAVGCQIAVCVVGKRCAIDARVPRKRVSVVVTNTRKDLVRRVVAVNCVVTSAAVPARLSVQLARRSTGS